MKTFGTILKKLRKEKGLTQLELAEMIGVKASSIGGWEHGRAKPQADTLELLAEVLGTTPNELMGIDNENISEFEKWLTKKGLKDKINSLSPKQFEALILLIDSFNENKD